jgi:glutamate/tyrosine decarboxylase-like PLP-dependent enzyme
MEKIIEASPDLELLATGPLTAVCFRYVPANWSGNDQDLDRLNQAIVGDVQTGGRAFLAGTDIRGHFALRSCALHYALNEDHVESIVGAVRDAGSLRVSACRSADLPGSELTSPGDDGGPSRNQRREDLKCAR